MRKEKLLRIIDWARRMEEDAVESFSKHIKASSDWVHFNKSEKLKVVSILKTLEKDSHKHKILLDELKDNVLRGNKNDY